MTKLLGYFKQGFTAILSQVMGKSPEKREISELIIVYALFLSYSFTLVILIPFLYR